MTLQECYEILHVDNAASIEDIKRAYRNLAFTLHPDLNPMISEESIQFQNLNEAYVILLKFYQYSGQQPYSTQQTTSKMDIDYHTTSQSTLLKENKTKKTSQHPINNSTKKQSSSDHTTKTEHNFIDISVDEPFDRKQEILQDILNDDFAKNVFEDIFREVQKKKNKSSDKLPLGEKHRSKIKNFFQWFITTITFHKNSQKALKQHEIQPIYAQKTNSLSVKHWLRSQIDEVQSIELPVSLIQPSSRIRLHIRRGLSEELITLDFTLPEDFNYTKELCFKGMGKKLGRWEGDLYLRLIPK